MAARLQMLAVFADCAAREGIRHASSSVHSAAARRVKVPLRVLMGLWGEAAVDSHLQHPHHQSFSPPALDEAEARACVERLAGEHLLELCSEADAVAEEVDDAQEVEPLEPAAPLLPPQPASKSPAPLSPPSLPNEDAKQPSPSPPTPGSRNDGRAIMLLEPIAEYLRCRSRTKLSDLHARLVRSCHVSEITSSSNATRGSSVSGQHRHAEHEEHAGDEGDEGGEQQQSSYWTAARFLHHLRCGGESLGSDSFGSIRRLDLANFHSHAAATMAASKAEQGAGAGEAGAAATESIAKVLGAALTRGALCNLIELTLDRPVAGGSERPVTNEPPLDEDPGGAIAIATSMDVGALAHLRKLTLAGTGLRDAGFAALIGRAALGALRELRTLDVARNAIGNAGATALSAAVARGGLPLIAVLDLGANRIGDQGIIELARALKPSKDHGGCPSLRHLTELRLDDNPFGDLGLSSLSYTCCEGGLAEGALKLSAQSQQRLEQLSPLVRQAIAKCRAQSTQHALDC